MQSFLNNFAMMNNALDRMIDILLFSYIVIYDIRFIKLYHHLFTIEMANYIIRMQECESCDSSYSFSLSLHYFFLISALLALDMYKAYH